MRLAKPHSPWVRSAVGLSKMPSVVAARLQSRPPRFVLVLRQRSIRGAFSKFAPQPALRNGRSTNRFRVNELMSVESRVCMIPDATDTPKS